MQGSWFLWHMIQKIRRKIQLKIVSPSVDYDMRQIRWDGDTVNNFSNFTCRLPRIWKFVHTPLRKLFWIYMFYYRIPNKHYGFCFNFTVLGVRSGLLGFFIAAVFFRSITTTWRQFVRLLIVVCWWLEGVAIIWSFVRLDTFVKSGVQITVFMVGWKIIV